MIGEREKRRKEVYLDTDVKKKISVMTKERKMEIRKIECICLFKY